MTVEGGPGRPASDVTVLAAPESPGDEIVRAVERVIGVTGPLPLWDERGPLPVENPLSSTGLHDGARLGVGRPGGASRDQLGGGTELRVVGGPTAGLVVRLGIGRAVIGRHQSCDISVPDAEMSREHAELQLSADGTMTLRDLGSSNGTSLEGTALGSTAVPFAPGQVVQAGASYFSVHPVEPLDGDLADDGQCGYVFNRRYRIRRPSPAVDIEFPVAQVEEDRSGFPWLMMGAPLVLAIGMAALLHRPEYLLLAVMSPVMTVGSTLHDRQNRKRQGARAAATFDQKQADADQQALVAVQEERDRRRADAPDPAVLVLTATGPRGRLWERRAADDDQLCLRVGLGTLPSVVHMANHPSPPPAWAVPVVVDLPAVGVLGVAGPREVAQAAARALVLQAAVLHSPDDVRVVVLTDSSAQADWAWVQWLPHTQLDPGAGVVGIGNDPYTQAARVKELQRLVGARAEQRSTSGPAPLPRVLVVIDGARQLRSLPGMLTVLREGAAAGVYSICLDEARNLLPEESRAVVAWDDDAGAATVEQHGMAAVSAVALDRPSAARCESAARAIAPIHRIGGDSGSGGVPATARLTELAGLDPPEPAEIRRRWSAPGRGPRALLGVAEHGPLVLDLAADGPHGLVAGTTGAGKSELLQTLVAGLALSSPPDELNVVLVDYKGGAAFRDCRALPHTVGLVTDLDAHLTERALRSLHAELKRREHVLAEAGAKDIGDYVDARERRPGHLPPLPRLVIVIDEFASLVVELPDFIKGLVGIAQRGRSLGVHLVLATQRPTGTVSPEIRANANFAIALRVVNGAESADIIGTPAAATISPATPGRAFLRISQEPPVSFQTARVGGRRPGAVDTAAAVTAFTTTWAGLGLPDPSAPSAETPADEVTDLHGLVDAVRQAADASASPPQRQPWLEPLPELLTLEQLDRTAGVGATTGSPAADHPGADGALPLAGLPFGLYDLPDEQSQRPATFDPAGGRHLLFAGSPRAGRTSVLRSVAAAVARTCAVDDLHLYGLDCGNGGLLPLRDLPQCGAVVTRTEPDRTERLLGRLADEVRRRQATLVDRGLATAAEQRQHPGDDAPWPYLVLLVDGWDGFVDAFRDHKDGLVEQLLLGLLRDGAAAGLTVVMTGDRSALAAGRVSSLFGDRFSLRFNDRDDYSLAGLAPRKMPERVPAGRAFRAATGEELQIALLSEDPAGPQQAAAFVALAEIARKRAADRSSTASSERPIHVDALPTRIGLTQAATLPDIAESRAAPRSVLAVLAGVGGDELAPIWVDLADHGPGFVVTGSPESGRSTALLAIGTTLLDRGCRVVVVTPRPSPLSSLGGRDRVVVLDGAAGRAPKLEGPAMIDALDIGPHEPLAVLVDDAELVDPDDAWLVELASGPAGTRAVVVGGAVEPLRDGFRGLPLYAKRNGSGLLLSPRSHLDAGVFNATLPAAAASPGRPAAATSSSGAG